MPWYVEEGNTLRHIVVVKADVFLAHVSEMTNPSKTPPDVTLGGGPATLYQTGIKEPFQGFGLISRYKETELLHKILPPYNLPFLLTFKKAIN